MFSAEICVFNSIANGFLLLYKKFTIFVIGILIGGHTVEIDISNAFIETERLILRPWHKEDLQDFYEYASVPGVGEMAGWKHHESIDKSEEILKLFIEGKSTFAVQYKENKKVIGSLGIHGSWTSKDEKYAHLNSKEIGYVLSKKYWGKGLMAEAVKAVINYCFKELGLEALTICHFVENIQSKRVIEKCGFEFVKYDKYYAKGLEKEFDEMQYILMP